MTDMTLHNLLIEMAAAIEKAADADTDEEREAHLADAETVWKTNLTVFDRVPIAALLIAAKGKTPSKGKVAEVLRCSPGNLSTTSGSEDIKHQARDLVIESAKTLSDWLLGGLTSQRTMADADKQIEQMTASVVAERAKLAKKDAEIAELKRSQQAAAQAVRAVHDRSAEEHRELVRTTERVVREFPTPNVIEEPTDA